MSYNYTNYEKGVKTVQPHLNGHSTYLECRRLLKLKTDNTVVYAGATDEIYGVALYNQVETPPESWKVALGTLPDGAWPGPDRSSGVASTVEVGQDGTVELDVGSTDACVIAFNDYVGVSQATADADTGKVAPWKPGFSCIGRAVSAGAKNGRVRVQVGVMPPPQGMTVITATQDVAAKTADYIFNNPSSGVLTATLADPVANDNGRTVIKFHNNKAKANVISCGTGKINGAKDTVTFAAIGDWAIFTAYGTGWLVQTNGTIGPT
jgi:hypothetical protein